ncbi:hypothetical protein NECAME_17202 [Necator americanus]|uniref:Uncharacterized protein n=1 Tax=Necator americanus TaxID=51031 RepID=W2TQ62_NECAM|nr:hypothetical protein NECAME_17202 [Necator americanus]ETN84215.1 hypothetical protein NECAME_17202 [Necator americanus]
MVKYNYLLNALKGEARDYIRKFQIIKDNYFKAINFLLVKYNNREDLINQLVERLDQSVLRSPSIKDRRHLLEQVQVIVAQLTEKGEGVNSPWLIKKVLAKLPDSVKRKVIAKKQGLSADVPFTMQHLFKFIGEILFTEEMFLSFSEKSPPMQQRQVNNNIRPHLMTKCCMYCKNNYPSHSCIQYSTPQDRSAYLRKEQLCMICASPKHRTTKCKGRPCFNCKRLHHTSCCFKNNTESRPSQNKGNNPTNIARPQEKVKERINKGSSKMVRSNVIANSDNTTSETSILQLQTILNTNNNSK